MENSELIAEFMGFQKTNIGWYDSEEIMPPLSNTYDSNTFDEHELAFHTSWDWLMPVVSKITRDEILIENEYRESIMDTVPYGLIEDTYKVVVEFINEYNKNK